MGGKIGKKQRFSLLRICFLCRNRSVYILTAVLEPPFLMYKKPLPGQPAYGNARFEGYTKDLAELLARELNLLFEIQVVKDGQYGISDPSVPGGWTGMIGELVRNEADIAISPLTINAQREQVVDFTVPFMQVCNFIFPDFFKEF